MVEFLNTDCIEYMKTLPDNTFDLAIVDPPYGLGIDGQKLNNTNKNPKHNRKHHEFKNWDNKIPDAEYFYQLKRVSKNQIVWGGNYFTEYLPPTKAWIFWYKGQNDLTMSDGEMAWTSFKTVTRQVNINRFKIQQDGSIHPTQKPVKLYRWLLQRYANPGDKIFDSHGGSMSHAVACHDMGFDLVICEIDKGYYDRGIKWYNDEIKQLKLL